MTALTRLINRFSTYLLIGVANTLLCFLIMYLGHLSGMGYLLYTAVGYLLTVIFSFFMNLRFTFRVKGELLRRLGKFLSVSLINLFLVECIEYTLIEKFDYNQALAIVCGMFWYVVAGFLASHFWVYRARGGLQ